MSIYVSATHHKADPLLAAFVESVHQVLDDTAVVPRIVSQVEQLTGELLAQWRMPDARYLAAQPGCRYGSYLLYRAPDSSFVVVIDTFDEGQSTQIHNHRTWAVVGLLDGAERNEIFRIPGDWLGPPQPLDQRVTRAGEVITMMESEMHRLCTDQGAISLSFHVYGADVGTVRRLRWDESSGAYCEFRQGWSNDIVGLPIYLDCHPLSEQELRQRCAGYLNSGAGSSQC